MIPGEIGTRPKAGGVHECNSFFKNCLLQEVSFTVDSNLLQPTVGADNTPHTSLFLMQ